MNRYLAWLIITAVIVSSGISRADERGAQKFEGFDLQGYGDTGEKTWDVKGDTADVMGDKIKITNVDANRYGKQQMNLKAKTGTVDKASGNILLQRDVVITTDDGGKLVTDTLNWQKEADLVTTDDLVVITHDDRGMMASGTGLEAKPGLKEAQLNKDVTVKVNTEPEKTDGRVVTITCDGPMVIDQKLNIATFKDNVVAVQNDRILKADRMEIYFNPDTNQIEETICIGNVAITQNENTTYSEKAVYNANTQKLTLSGRPKLIMVTEGEGSMGGLAGE